MALETEDPVQDVTVLDDLQQPSTVAPAIEDMQGPCTSNCKSPTGVVGRREHTFLYCSCVS